MGNGKRVLFISYDGMTDPLGQSQVLPYLGGLSAAGYSITLISCEKPERYEENRETIEGICAQKGIQWMPVSYHSKPPVISTLQDIRTIYRLAVKLHRANPFEIVHCRSYISALVGQRLKKKLGIRFLFDMRGFWADERVDGGLWNLQSPVFGRIYKYFKKKEIEFLEQADHIVSLTHDAKAEMNSWKLNRTEGLPITVIPCCVDTQLFDPQKINAADKQKLKQQLGLKPDEPVMGYVGSIGTWYMLSEMLEVFKTFRTMQPKARMLFVTTEKADAFTSALAQTGLTLEELIIIPAKRAEVPLFLSIMDYSLFFIKPAFSKKASSPTKQGEIMAMGKPVICNTGVGDTDKVVTRYQSGTLVPEFKDSSYNKALETLLATNFNPEQIRAGALEYYGLEAGIASYKKIYDDLTNAKA